MSALPVLLGEAAAMLPARTRTRPCTDPDACREKTWHTAHLTGVGWLVYGGEFRLASPEKQAELAALGRAYVMAMETVAQHAVQVNRVALSALVRIVRAPW